MPTLVSAVLATASFVSIQVVYPTTAWSRLFIGGRTDSLPQWWASTLYIVTVVACLLRGAREWASTAPRPARRAAPRGRRWVARAWCGTAALLLVLSIDHVLRIHAALEDWQTDAGLLSALAHRPVQVLLVVAGIPLALVLLAGVSTGQRLFLLGAAGTYGAAAVLLDARVLAPPWSYERLETLEMAMEWAALQLVLVAAVWGVRWRQPWARQEVDGRPHQALRNGPSSDPFETPRFVIALPEERSDPLSSGSHRPAASRDRPSRALNDRRLP